MKLNKKYFSTIFIALTIQFILGTNFANAICDNEKRIYCAEELKYRVGSSDWKNCNNQNDVRVNELIELFKHNRQYYASDEEYINYQLVNELKVQDYKSAHSDHVYRRARNDFELCVLKHTLNSQGSTSSAQTNNDPNQQSANNQPSSSISSSEMQASQQNSTHEDEQRNSVRSYSSQQTIAYQQKYKGRGKKHNLDAVANRCIKTKGQKVLNTCDFNVEVVFCAVNPDPNSKHAFEMANGFDCARNSKGMWGISANDALMGVFTAESVNVFACKKPSLPGAEVDHQTMTLVGRCSEY